MPELTDAQKVVRNDTAKRMADALEALAGTGGRGLPAGGTDGDVLVKNGATDYAGRWTKTPPQMGSLATIEPTSSASKAYAAGDYLVYNGQLYKATGTISPDETLTPGGNIRAVSVTDELQTISAKMLKDNYLQASDTFFSLDVANTRDMVLITFNRYGRFASFFAPYLVLILATSGIQVPFGTETITVYGNGIQMKIVPSNTDIHDVYFSAVEIVT